MVPKRWTSDVPNESWGDERLVAECLNGNEDAWAALIEKYKNLIFSIPVKLGFSRDDAGDIFQQVCLKLLRELPQLRDPNSLTAWLIKVSSHSCYEWHRRERRYETVSDREQPWDHLSSQDMADKVTGEAEREQILRQALRETRPRCRRLIEMLFFENPPVSYAEIARRLGVATGSIGFIRMRCLRNLRQFLSKKGF
jgi:RNA polymerase sigma factor (sigma-70 family)